MADRLSQITNAIGRAGEAATSSVTTTLQNLRRRSLEDAEELSIENRAAKAALKRADTAIQSAIGSATGGVGVFAYKAAKSFWSNQWVQAFTIGGVIFLIVTIANASQSPIQFLIDHRETIEAISSSSSQSQSLNYYVHDHVIANAGNLGVTSSAPNINWTVVCDYLGGSDAVNARAQQIALATQDADAPPFQICLAAKAAAQVLTKN